MINRHRWHACYKCWKEIKDEEPVFVGTETYHEECWITND